MRVLLVEDERTMADVIVEGLGANGFEVDVVHDGLAGLWRAREHPYDAIVLDIMLPGLNGYQVCRKLRDAEVWTPILMLTAKDGEYDEAEALDTGADDYLAKPFSFVVLVARLRALLRRDPTPRRALLVHGDLSLDPVSGTCRRAGQVIPLSAREASLLAFLLRRPGQVVPKGEILDGVWGVDFPGDSNIVEVYMGYLRRKVDRPFGTNSLRTLRGLGYQFSAHG